LPASSGWKVSTRRLRVLVSWSVTTGWGWPGWMVPQPLSPLASEPHLLQGQLLAEQGHGAAQPFRQGEFAA